MRRRLTAALAALMLTSGLLGVSTLPAEACPAGQTCDDGGSGDGGGGGNGDLTSGTKTESYNTPSRSCSVYANGAGMGSYCVTAGGGTAESLRERFGDQKLQRCRYSEIPPGVPQPFNSRPDEGRYMIMTCLGNIDFDTVAGGPDRTLDISIVFVENGTDIDDRHNGITDFLWRRMGASEQMPVPFMRTQPNVTPLVGIPTFFTFRWIDPVKKDVVAQGPFADNPNGGPFKQIDVAAGGVTMRARADKIRINPAQSDMKAINCDPSTPYIQGAKSSDQPANACQLTFERSSASARKYATEAIPDGVDDAFYAVIAVHWRVTYGEDTDNMQELGDGFWMRLHQAVPVQEVQTPNQPPAVIY